MLTKTLLRYVSRSPDALVKFISDLDSGIDSYLSENEQAVAKCNDLIVNVHKDTEDRIAAIRAEADKLVSGVEATIAGKQKAATVLTNLKSALPTA